MADNEKMNEYFLDRDTTRILGLQIRLNFKTVKMLRGCHIYDQLANFLAGIGFLRLKASVNSVIVLDYFVGVDEYEGSFEEIGATQYKSIGTFWTLYFSNIANSGISRRGTTKRQD